MSGQDLFERILHSLDAAVPAAVRRGPCALSSRSAGPRAAACSGALRGGLAAVALLLLVAAGGGAATAAPATGEPVVSGTARVGETLTALTHAIRDDDRLTGVSYSYRWIRVDGRRERELSGATGRTYTLAADDQGKQVKVLVSFTDDEANAEERISAAFPSSGTIIMPLAPQLTPMGLWSANLVVQRLGSTQLGCSNGSGAQGCANSAVLSDDDFEIEREGSTLTRTVRFVALVSGELLIVGFDAGFTAAEDAILALKVTEGGTTTTLNFSDNTSVSSNTYSWGLTGLSWDAGDTVALSIRSTPVDATPPVLIENNIFRPSINSPGRSLSAYFSESLDQANRPPISAFSVTANGSPVTLSNLFGGVNGLEFTVSPVIRQGQTVTLSYTDPTDGDDVNAIQDRDGNDAASFTVEVRNGSTVTDRPGAPTGLEATAIGLTRIDLSWTAPGDRGHSAIAGYRIQWSANGSAPWRNLVADTGSTATAYSDTTLSAGTTRHYRVSAINGDGAGRPSNVDSATTRMGAPGKPTGLTATAMSGTRIDLAWSAPGKIGDSAISGYRIEWLPDGGHGSWSDLVADTDSTVRAYSDTGLASETTRHYRVSAINDDGAGRPSVSASATTEAIVEEEPPVETEAWIARFGRSVAEQVLDAVESRFAATRRPGLVMSLAGEALRHWNAAAENDGENDGAARRQTQETEAGERMAAFSDWLHDGQENGRDGGETASPLSRAVTQRDLLTGTSLALTGRTAGGGAGAFWGRGAMLRFDGREGDLTLEGEVTSAMLGADWSGDALIAGLLLSHSRGEGSYRGVGDGALSSTVTGLYPYGRYSLGSRVDVWGVAGYGEGSLTLKPKDGKALETDMVLTMGAIGLRGVVLEAPNGGGLELAVTSDAMAVRTTSVAAIGGDGGRLAAAEGDVTRLRLGLEGSWRGGALIPRLAVGIRQDGGDAETGFGVDIGGGLAWSNPAWGVSAEVSARGLLTHEAGGLSDTGIAGSLSWQPDPAAGRGPSLTLSQTFGGSSQDGMEALLGRETLAGLAANDNGEDELQRRRMELRLGYGLSAFGGGFTSTPELGLGLSNGHREYSLGWRLNRVRGPTALEMWLEATRRESTADNEDPVHGIDFRVNARF